MKLKDGLITEEIGGEFITVATGETSRTFNGLIRSNETAEFLLALLMENTTEDELVSALLENYDVSENQARQDVHDLIEKLMGAGLLE